MYVVQRSIFVTPAGNGGDGGGGGAGGVGGGGCGGDGGGGRAGGNCGGRGGRGGGCDGGLQFAGAAQWNSLRASQVDLTIMFALQPAGQLSDGHTKHNGGDEGGGDGEGCGGGDDKEDPQVQPSLMQIP